MNIAYIGLGSNLSNKKENLNTAIIAIQKNCGAILKQSQIYETEAWGNTNQPVFNNQVIIIYTSLNAEELLKQLLLIEVEMGRVRNKKNDARIIDLDILFYNQQNINKPQLIIPHPEIENRKFVLVPLNEIVPYKIHPILNKRIYDLLVECKDELEVRNC